MSGEIVQGLEISLIGIVVIFLTMGILVLVIALLERLFRERPQEPQPKLTEPATSPVEALQSDEDERVVVAIAAALTHLRSLGMARSGLGDDLASGPSTWWLIGQVKDTQVGLIERQEEK
jgi:sodium pump decarboxylase gamma subunit